MVSDTATTASNRASAARSRGSSGRRVTVGSMGEGGSPSALPSLDVLAELVEVEGEGAQGGLRLRVVAARARQPVGGLLQAGGDPGKLGHPPQGARLEVGRH